MMDTQRLILLFIFGFSVLMLWEAWQKDTRPKPAPSAPAVQQGPNGPYAWVINPDGTVTTRPVKVAQISGGQALIDSGLSAGEQVVVDGQYKLQPGIHVTILHGKAAEEAAAQDAQRTPIP